MLADVPLRQFMDLLGFHYSPLTSRPNNSSDVSASIVSWLKSFVYEFIVLPPLPMRAWQYRDKPVYIPFGFDSKHETHSLISYYMGGMLEDYFAFSHGKRSPI